jgi:L-methionine (R)-S-oxide reductase
MAEQLFISPNADKKERYSELIPQLKSLTEGETDLIANLSNIIAALKQSFDFFWVGFYFVKNNELVLGPFQGPVACTRITLGKGVCGKAWELAEAILVEDVEKFPGHIACSSESKSEIVLPVKDNLGKVCMVLDIDSDKLADFDSIDEHYLNEVVRHIESLLATKTKD